MVKRMNGITKNKMVKITLSIPPELDKKLRDLVKSEYLDTRGAMSWIVANALKDYFAKIEADKDEK